MKSPPVQYHDDEARRMVEEFIRLIQNRRTKQQKKQPAVALRNGT
jgi:hypothetical protein